MGALHERSPFPLLTQLALAHYQFEAIHPYLDGNGRLGRLLIPLVLAERNVLDRPLLYLSVFFEKNRAQYYDLLLATSLHGDFEPWLCIFFEGVRSQAADADECTVCLMDLQQETRQRLQEERATSTAMRLAEFSFGVPYFTVPTATQELGVTTPTVQNAIDFLVKVGHLQEVTGKSRARIYFAHTVFNAIYRETVESRDLGE